MTVGEKVRERRKELELSQQQLADAVHVGQSMICQIERGTKSLSIGLGAEIARVLGCRLEDFLESGH